MLTPTERWMRPDVGATQAEADFLADWYDQIGSAAPGATLITSASYSDWDLQQQLEVWRGDGTFPPDIEGSEAEAAPEEAPAKASRASKAAAEEAPAES